MIDSSGPPLSLYVHLPWCVRRCPYCDFNAHARPRAGLPESEYLVALIADLEASAPGCGRRRPVSVFFGGGTPSLFSPQSIERLLEAADRVLGLPSGAEITLEANPGTIEHGRFSAYRAAGINRVSLGAQSFDDAMLAALGRIHSHLEIEAAVAELHRAGLGNFNLDLMYALPGQTIEQARRDVERALELSPAHVSHYQLTLEPGTPFSRRPPVLPDDEAAWEMQLACSERLSAAGFAQYEVSAWSRPGMQCRHNLNYWRFGDYLGLGAGAHGKLTDRGSGSVRRTARVSDPAAYLAAGSQPERLAEDRIVTAEELPFEFCLNVLRLGEGFDADLFEQRTGLPLACLQPRLDEAQARGLMAQDRSGHWIVTRLGTRFLNDLQAVFLPSGGPGRPDRQRSGSPRRSDLCTDEGRASDSAP
ncbi:MAG TPA: radical SAM family heme chaperone HemW [Steroidobacteraceae bacterium]|nr:radical SAM family heme chaperone HemW [Steroidobacteraceae bacterium]